MARVLVRDARPSDAERVSEVAAASWRVTYGDIFEPSFIDDFLARNYASADLARAAARSAEREDAHFLVVERNGEVVAFAQYGIGRRGPELFRIYAHPSQYGTGVGHALLVELERRLAGHVASYVVDVHSRNDRGRLFYDRHEFEVVGGGETQDCDLTMRRTLPLTTQRGISAH